MPNRRKNDLDIPQRVGADFLKQFIEDLDRIADALDDLAGEGVAGSGDIDQRRKLLGLKQACIKALNDCHRDTKHLPNALTPFKTHDTATMIAGLRLALRTLAKRMCASQANGFNHPVVRVSNAPLALREEWKKHEDYLLQTLAWLEAHSLPSLKADVAPEITPELTPQARVALDILYRFRHATGKLCHNGEIEAVSPVLEVMVRAVAMAEGNTGVLDEGGGMSELVEHGLVDVNHGGQDEISTRWTTPAGDEVYATWEECHALGKAHIVRSIEIKGEQAWQSVKHDDSNGKSCGQAAFRLTLLGYQVTTHAHSAVKASTIRGSVDVKSGEKECLAYESYQWVCAKFPQLVEDLPKGLRYSEAMHNCAREYFIGYEGTPFDLPRFETWKKYINTHERQRDGPKNSSRCGREHGPSIVKVSQSDPAKSRADFQGRSAPR